MIKFLCENAEKQGLSVNLTSIFTFIGMAFCIIVALVALVWLTCFIVRLLVKTFKKQVQNSYDVFIENCEAKTQSKKERNAIKRQNKDARKMEILKMKEESKDKIHQMKVEKLSGKLAENELKTKEKYSLEDVDEIKNIENKKQEKPTSKKQEKEDEIQEGNEHKSHKKEDIEKEETDNNKE